MHNDIEGRPSKEFQELRDIVLRLHNDYEVRVVAVSREVRRRGTWRPRERWAAMRGRQWRRCVE